MAEQEIQNTPQEEEQGLDIIALLRQLWSGRKTVIICTVIFIALGLVAALTMKRTYSVTTVMVPQMNNKSGGTLVSLASLAGFDMGMNTGGGELSPLVYPQIVNSTPFRLEMMHTPLHFKEVAQPVSLYDYAYYYAKPTLMDQVKRYTIGLPGLIIGAIRGPEQEVQYAVGGAADTTNVEKPLVVSVKESKMLEDMGKLISLDVDKKEGYLTMKVNGSEPIQTAELALKAQQLLQEEITRFRIEKSESDLAYVQARFDEIKRENNISQEQLAALTDKAQNIPTTRARLDQERARTKYTVTSSIYTELAKQLEQAKMQVKKDTPVFTIVQPVTVPMKPSNSRAKTLIIWTFFGFVVGCGIVLFKFYWPQVKDKFAAPEKAEPEGDAKPETKQE